MPPTRGTARRAVPSGRLSKSYMFAALLFCACIFIVAADGFWLLYRNVLPVVLAAPVLLFLVGYSLMKRYTRLCHYYLGAALALAPLCAWVAIAGTLSLAPVLMGLAVLLWTAGFDIIYACQDYDFDTQHKLFSVPAKIGIGPALWVARVTHLMSVCFYYPAGMVHGGAWHFFRNWNRTDGGAAYHRTFAGKTHQSFESEPGIFYYERDH